MMKTKNGLVNFVAFALVGTGLLTLSACNEPEAPVETGPIAPEGVSVKNGWMSMPAVAGNPASVYFHISNDSANQATIRTAEVQGSASAVMHETATWNLQTDMQELFQQPVMPGESVDFAPGGKHIMVMELDETLAVGGETEVTLKFVGGDEISFTAEMRAPGDEPDHSEHMEEME